MSYNKSQPITTNLKLVNSFEDLEVWQVGKDIVMRVYHLTKDFPKQESFGLTSQMREAALSVPANIAEGFGRYHYLDKAKFYLNARGSLYELKSHLLIAQELGYFRKEIRGDSVETHRDWVKKIPINYNESQSISINIFQMIDSLSVKLNNLITATRKRSKESR